MMTLTNQGSTIKMPDYQKAFMEDMELPQVISKIGGQSEKSVAILPPVSSTMRTIWIV